MTSEGGGCIRTGVGDDRGDHQGPSRKRVKLWRRLEKFEDKELERCQAEVASSREIPTREGENTNMEGASFHANSADHSRRSRESESGEPHLGLVIWALVNLFGALVRAIFGPISLVRAFGYCGWHGPSGVSAGGCMASRLEARENSGVKLYRICRVDLVETMR